MNTQYSKVLPIHRDLFYGGAWHAPRGGYADTINPATGQSLGQVAEADATDVDAAVRAAEIGAACWRETNPLDRAIALRRLAQVLRDNADELALIDALNCGNPVREMRGDVMVAAAFIDYCAGMVTEVKGETIPMGPRVVNLSLREPYGVVARIVAYNHPLLFFACKLAAPLAAGNSVIIKAAYQAPLSALRAMELAADVFPPGVVNLVLAGRPGSEALVAHPAIPRLSLVGSVETGRSIARAAADRLKHVTLELGGKNACVIYPDADIVKAAVAAVNGMNFTWCGQSCGSTSRLFVHETVYDQVMDVVRERVKHYRPGDPTLNETTMGALISQAQLAKVVRYTEIARSQGASLVCGGRQPDMPTDLQHGFFFEPTVFADVDQGMRIANEEVFGPLLSVIKWRDEDSMLQQVNAVDYGLTASIWTQDLRTAHMAASKIAAGFVWVNQVSAHFLGASFGGYKQSGIGREESLEEIFSFTQSKNVHIAL